MNPENNTFDVGSKVIIITSGVAGVIISYNVCMYGVIYNVEYWADTRQPMEYQGTSHTLRKATDKEFDKYVSSLSNFGGEVEISLD